MANSASKNDIASLVSIGVDIGKEVFHLVGFDGDGKLVLRQKIKRLALVSTFEKFPRCIVGMELSALDEHSRCTCRNWVVLSMSMPPRSFA